MKTIFFTISDGEVAKSILQSDIFSRLQERAKLIVFVHQNSHEHFSRLLYAENIIVEVLPPAQNKFLEEFFSDLFLYSLHTESIRIKIEHSYLSGGSYTGKLVKLFLWQMGRFRLYRSFCRALYYVLRDKAFDSFFSAHRPDIVFAANLTSAEDARLLASAKRYHVQSVGLPKGWDNLTLKTFLPVFPDKLLVQTELMKKDALALDYPAEKVHVVGFPKFDLYADRSVLLSREAFMQKFGLDATKKLILYAGAGDQLAPYDEDILADFLSAIEKGDIKGEPQVIVRPHPKYRYRAEILPVRPFWKLDRPGHKVSEKSSDFEFSREDVIHLMNSLYHCDLLVHTASTLGIEAAIFDKPSITISYDASTVVPDGRSVSRYYRYEHLRRVVRTSGMKVANNFAELVRYTNAYLEDPAQDRDGREKITKENTHSIDGKAAERVVSHILSL